VHVRVELPLGRDLGETLPPERARQLPVHEPNALFERRFFVLLGGRQRAFQVVDDREQLLDEPLRGPGRKALLLARDPLAVVLELRREALEVVQVRLSLGLGGGEPLLKRLAFCATRFRITHRLAFRRVILGHLVELLLCRIDRHYEVFASSSTISASSITSSSEVDAVPFVPAPAACWADACS
jgi:hypothetical protein